MISELALDLLTKLQGVPALVNSCGLDLLGNTPDPGGAKIVPPAAWIIAPKSAKNTRDGAANIPSPALNVNAQFQFIVGLYLPSGSQIATQLPLIEVVVKAIHGTTSPSGQRWFWSSMERAATNPGVIVYAIAFDVNATF
jgi:hypothetical protein